MQTLCRYGDDYCGHADVTVMVGVDASMGVNGSIRKPMCGLCGRSMCMRLYAVLLLFPIATSPCALTSASNLQPSLSGGSWRLPWDAIGVWCHRRSSLLVWPPWALSDMVGLRLFEPGGHRCSPLSPLPTITCPIRPWPVFRFTLFFTAL